MFVCHPLTGNFPVVPLLFFGKLMFLALFVRQFRVAVNSCNPKIAGVCFRCSILVDVGLGFFKKPEIMALSVCESRANDRLCSFIYNDL
jgi:hypothetical protein